MEAIHHLSSQKYTGYINIPINLFKHSRFHIFSSEVHSLNVREYRVPNVLKIAEVAPLSKGNLKQTLFLRQFLF